MLSAVKQISKLKRNSNPKAGKVQKGKSSLSDASFTDIANASVEDSTQQSSSAQEVRRPAPAPKADGSGSPRSSSKDAAPAKPSPPTPSATAAARRQSPPSLKDSSARAAKQSPASPQKGKHRKNSTGKAEEVLSPQSPRSPSPAPWDSNSKDASPSAASNSRRGSRKFDSSDVKPDSEITVDASPQAEKSTPSPNSVETSLRTSLREAAISVGGNQNATTSNKAASKGPGPPPPGRPNTPTAQEPDSPKENRRKSKESAKNRPESPNENRRRSKEEETDDAARKLQKRWKERRDVGQIRAIYHKARSANEKLGEQESLQSNEDTVTELQSPPQSQKAKPKARDSVMNWNSAKCIFKGVQTVLKQQAVTQVIEELKSSVAEGRSKEALLEEAIGETNWHQLCRVIDVLINDVRKHVEEVSKTDPDVVLEGTVEIEEASTIQKILARMTVQLQHDVGHMRRLVAKGENCNHADLDEAIKRTTQLAEEFDSESKKFYYYMCFFGWGSVPSCQHCMSCMERKEKTTDWPLIFCESCQSTETITSYRQYFTCKTCSKGMGADSEFCVCPLCVGQPNDGWSRWVPCEALQRMCINPFEAIPDWSKVLDEAQALLQTIERKTKARFGGLMKFMAFKKRVVEKKDAFQKRLKGLNENLDNEAESIIARRDSALAKENVDESAMRRHVLEEKAQKLREQGASEEEIRNYFRDMHYAAQRDADELAHFDPEMKITTQKDKYLLAIQKKKRKSRVQENDDDEEEVFGILDAHGNRVHARHSRGRRIKEKQGGPSSDSDSDSDSHADSGGVIRKIRSNKSKVSGDDVDQFKGLAHPKGPNFAHMKFGARASDAGLGEVWCSKIAEEISPELQAFVSTLPEESEIQSATEFAAEQLQQLEDIRTARIKGLGALDQAGREINDIVFTTIYTRRYAASGRKSSPRSNANRRGSDESKKKQHQNQGFPRFSQADIPALSGWRDIVNGKPVDVGLLWRKKDLRPDGAVQEPWNLMVKVDVEPSSRVDELEKALCNASTIMGASHMSQSKPSSSCVMSSIGPQTQSTSSPLKSSPLWSQPKYTPRWPEKPLKRPGHVTAPRQVTTPNDKLSLDFPCLPGVLVGAGKPQPPSSSVTTFVATAQRFPHHAFGSSRSPTPHLDV